MSTKFFNQNLTNCPRKTKDIPLSPEFYYHKSTQPNWYESFALWQLNVHIESAGGRFLKWRQTNFPKIIEFFFLHFSPMTLLSVNRLSGQVLLGLQSDTLYLGGFSFRVLPWRPFRFGASSLTRPRMILFFIFISNYEFPILDDDNLNLKFALVQTKNLARPTALDELD